MLPLPRALFSFSISCFLLCSLNTANVERRICGDHRNGDNGGSHIPAFFRSVVSVGLGVSAPARHALSISLKFGKFTRQMSSQVSRSNQIRVRVYNCLKGFHVPVQFAGPRNIHDPRVKEIEIRRRGALIYKGEARVSSGTEIRSGPAVKTLKRGEWITVRFP